MNIPFFFSVSGLCIYALLSENLKLDSVEGSHNSEIEQHSEKMWIEMWITTQIVSTALCAVINIPLKLFNIFCKQTEKQMCAKYNLLDRESIWNKTCKNCLYNL